MMRTALRPSIHRNHPRKKTNHLTASWITCNKKQRFVRPSLSSTLLYEWLPGNCKTILKSVTKGNGTKPADPPPLSRVLPLWFILVTRLWLTTTTALHQKVKNKKIENNNNSKKKKIILRIKKNCLTAGFLDCRESIVEKTKNKASFLSSHKSLDEKK